MNKIEIKKTWKGLIAPFCIGFFLLILAIIWKSLGSHKSGSDVLSLFLGILGIMLVLFSGSKIFKFKKYLKTLHNTEK